MFNFALLEVLIVTVGFLGSAANLIHIGYFHPAKYLLLEESEVTIPYNLTEGKALSVESQYTARFKESDYITTIRISCDNTDTNVISVPQETFDFIGENHVNLKIMAYFNSTFKYKVQIYGFHSKYLDIMPCSNFSNKFGEEAICSLLKYEIPP